MKTLIIIPAYNEASAVVQVIVAVRKHYPTVDVLVVDDGSADSTGEAAQKAGARVLTHSVNRGLGGAIGTGLAYARVNAYQAAITIDADGQHKVEDIGKVLEVLVQDKADVVIGSRKLAIESSMPRDRKILNNLANGLTFLFFGVKTSDSQSGFRGFNHHAISLIEPITNRMEVSSEIFGEIKRHRLRYAEVPIQVIYTDYSRSKGQQNRNAITVFIKLVLRLFR